MTYDRRVYGKLLNQIFLMLIYSSIVEYSFWGYDGSIT